MPGDRLDPQKMAQRAAQEIRPGETVAVGTGLASGVPAVLPPGTGAWLMAESGAIGYLPATGSNVVDASGQTAGIVPGGAIVGTLDAAALLSGGHVGLAFLEAAQVSENGDFVHWTTAETLSLAAPGFAVDMAAGARRLVLMMTHAHEGGISRIHRQCSLPVDGTGCTLLIVTDIAVVGVSESGLELLEVAPGWSADDVAAMTEAPLAVSASLSEMTFEVPLLPWPNKVYESGADAVADIVDGSVVNVDGFGGPGGMAHYLMVSLRDLGAKGLTMISNTAGIAQVARFGAPEGVTPIDHTILVENGQIGHAIATYPVSPSINRPSAFERAFLAGESTLEVSPQGTLAERLRSGGAGVAAFYTPTGAGTLLAEGKELREINGRSYVLEQGIVADFCIIRGHKADTLGNMVYKGTSRNFNPVMATAARTTIVEVDEIVQPGELDPEAIVTPGVFVDRIVKRPDGFSPYL